MIHLGLLCLGRSDLEAAEGFTDGDWFKEALGIRRVFSDKTLRQRLDPPYPAF